MLLYIRGLCYRCVFTICKLRAQKLIYSDKKQYNAEVICPDDSSRVLHVVISCRTCKESCKWRPGIYVVLRDMNHQERVTDGKKM